MSLENTGVCGKCGEPLPPDSSAGICPGCLISLVMEPQEFPGVGREFGGYILEEVIARGGMGIVYRARQKSINRIVALKMIIGGELASPEALRRFRAEAEAAGNLHHPNIVAIYEVGEIDHLPFFTMRYVEGSNLAGRMAEFAPGRDGRPQPERGRSQKETAAFLAKIARTIAHAHDRGVLHRDIKPTNILIDEEGEPQLADFGLAKLVNDEGAAVTKTQSAIGSPSYMAPEQASGESTTASDIWSLGAIGYEMLTGKPPFAGRTALETIRLAIDRPPLPLRRVNPGISRDFETVILTCLDKDPAKRYRSAIALAEDLERYERGEPILARPVGLGGMVWRWALRNPVPAVLTGALFLVLAGGFGATIHQAKRTEAANVALRASVDYLNWQQIRRQEEEGESASALARLATIIRDDPDHWQAASYAISILDEMTFAVPTGLSFGRPDKSPLQDLSWDEEGALVVSHGGGPEVWVREGRTGALVRTIPMADPVSMIALSNSGNALAVASGSGLTVYDPRTGEAGSSGLALGDTVSALAFGCDDEVLVIATESGLDLYNFPDLQLKTQISTGPGPTRSLTLSPDRNAVVAVAQQSATVVDLASGEVKGTFSAKKEIRTARLTNGAERLYLLSGSGIQGWEVATGREWEPVEPSFDDIILDFSVDPRSGWISTGTLSGIVERWDIPLHDRRSEGELHALQVKSTAISKDGTLLLTGSTDTTARLWDLDTLNPICEPILHSGDVRRADFLRGNTSILTQEGLAGREWTYRIWNVADGTGAGRFIPDNEELIAACAMSPDGKWVAVEGVTPGVTLYDLKTMEELEDPFPREDTVGVHFSPDSGSLLLVAKEGRISRWNLKTMKQEGVTIDVGFRTVPTHLSPDGSLVALAGPQGDVGVWDLRSGENLWKNRHKSMVSFLSFSPDGNRIVTTSNDRTAVVWDALSGRKVVEYTGHTQKVESASFSPDGKLVASGSQDLTVQVWDAATGERRLNPLIHRNAVTCLTFNQSGSRIASGTISGSIFEWEVTTGLPIFAPAMETGSIQTVRYSPDDERIFSASLDGIRVWDASTGLPVTTLLRQAPLNGIGVYSRSFEALSPDGTQFMVAGNCPEAVVWDLTRPPTPVPDWVPPLLEALAGQRVNEIGTIEALHSDEAWELLVAKKEEKESSWYPTRILRSLGIDFIP